MGADIIGLLCFVEGRAAQSVSKATEAAQMEIELKKKALELKQWMERQEESAHDILPEGPWYSPKRKEHSEIRIHEEPIFQAFFDLLAERDRDLAASMQGACAIDPTSTEWRQLKDKVSGVITDSGQRAERGFQHSAVSITHYNSFNEASTKVLDGSRAALNGVANNCKVT